jgi:hypothetical protein
MLTRFLQHTAAGYVAAVLSSAAATALLAPFHDQLSDTTVALAFLLVVLFVATGWGSWPWRKIRVDKKLHLLSRTWGSKEKEFYMRSGIKIFGHAEKIGLARDDLSTMADSTIA